MDRKYEAILWDFDGTLADTLALALEIYNQLAAEKNFRPITDPHAVRDMSMSEFLKSHDIAVHRMPLTFARFLREVRARAASIEFHSGIPSLLVQLRDAGLKLGVISSNSTENIKACLDVHDLSEHFQLVSGTSRLLGKEKRIRRALKELQVQSESVLYVGDEIRDIEAARAAGVHVASVTWGLNSSEALQRHAPDWLVSTPEELGDVILGRL